MALTAITSTMLEKTALDAGFDRSLGREGNWLRFSSSQARLKLALTAIGEGLFVAAFSQHHVGKALDEGIVFTNPLPAEAAAGRSVGSLDELHRMVRRAFVLSRTLPDELLVQFEKETAPLLRSTEVERLVVQRIGQDIFRRGLLDYWEGGCAVSGLQVPELLRASHIKRWADCSTDAERLDVHNGLLLAPHLDAAFDAALISFDDDGRILIKPTLDGRSLELLGFTPSMRLSRVTPAHRAYLYEHRKRFEG